MPKTLYDNSEITSNSKQLTLLKQHFPNCFDKEGNFISHKMEEIVGNEGLELSKESYSLNWLGKSYARLLANENPRTLLKEDKEHNAIEQNSKSENLLIKGDNLEVLKHLSHAYAEQIKMIYIDPPYNTGGDGFVYNDDRKFTVAELSKLAGVEEDEAKRILDFTQSKANSHSAWLTFMYPRLYVARELLREDGVIFISIDENEVAQLKLLCDEVFGEENFVANVVWERAFSPKNDAKFFSESHDYILVYAKRIDSLDLDKLERTEEANNRYKNYDNDKRGLWISDNLTVKTYSEKYDYPITVPSGRIINPAHGSCWRVSKEKLQILVDDNRIWFGKDGNNVPRLKRFLSEVQQGMVPMTLWKHKDVGHNQEARQELKKLFEDKGYFDGPKPLRLMKQILKISNLNKTDIILDFFAGSGTTAHAVMALNAKDQGKRKFITVQIDEKTDEKSEAYKAGYKSIFDITKARIEKASEQIGNNDGFKIFETTPMFEGYMDEIEELEENTTLFNGKALTPDELESLLTTWRVYDGMKLTEPLTVNLNGYNASYGAGTLYLMHQSFNMESLQALIEKLDNDKNFEPSKVVMFGYNFESKNQRELGEGLKNYTNKKNIELEMVVRY